MSTIENRSTLGDKFIKGISAKVFDIKNQADQAYSLAFDSALGVENNTFTKLFKTEKSNKARETIASKTGVGYATDTQEGSDFAMDSRVSGYETQFNFRKLTNGITITLENREDRIVDSKLDELRDLLVGFKQTINRDAFSIFNNAFTAQASLPNILTYYGDGVPACSTLHPIKATTSSNTTQSNASDTSLALSEINLETGRTAIRRQTDDKDLPMNIGSGKLILVVPDSLEKAAQIYTKGTLRPSTANNDINIYDGIMTVISSKWINSQNGGSDSAWFLVDSMKSPLVYFNRKGITTDTYKVDANKSTVVDAYTRYQVGNTDFRGLWGSKGDGTAYSS
jgi:hypothetical protein